MTTTSTSRPAGPEPARMLRALGVLDLLFGTIGLFFSAAAVFAFFRPAASELRAETAEAPFAVEAFVVGAALAASCFVALLGIGIAFLRGSVRWVPAFGVVLLVELALTVLPPLAAARGGGPVLTSVARTAGLATGGLVMQWFVLFPLWGFFAARWARDRLRVGAQ